MWKIQGRSLTDFKWFDVSLSVEVTSFDQANVVLRWLSGRAQGTCMGYRAVFTPEVSK